MTTSKPNRATALQDRITRFTEATMSSESNKAAGIPPSSSTSSLSFSRIGQFFHNVFSRHGHGTTNPPQDPPTAQTPNQKDRAGADLNTYTGISVDENLKAWQKAKENGWLPTPKIFVRPGLKGAENKSPSDDTSAPDPIPTTPTASAPTTSRPIALPKRHQRLAHRVSTLELKLQKARDELEQALAAATPRKENAQPLPSPAKSMISVNLKDKITVSTSTKSLLRKRKAVDTVDDGEKGGAEKENIPLQGEAGNGAEDGSQEKAADAVTAPSPKRQKSTTVKKPKSRIPTRSRSGSARLVKRNTTSPSPAPTSPFPAKPDEMDVDDGDDTVLVVVPDGVHVPAVPRIPGGVEGVRVVVGEKRGVLVRERVVEMGDGEGDEFGGLGHEIF